MRQINPVNLLDTLDALLQLPRDQRKARLDQLGLGNDERSRLEIWLRHHDSSDGFLEDSPALAREGMQLLQGGDGSSGSAGPTDAAGQRCRLGPHNIESCLPPEIDGYESSLLLGQGGMATVWRATQLGTGQDVALKVMNPLLFASPRARGRFERELRLTATLHHPSIARVYDGGVSGGVCYYAMELIQGAPLDQYVHGQHLSQRQVMELMRLVCEAVKHAHQNGVIHRDLKPSNILVDGEGHPRVLDFGLAKALAEVGPELTISLDGDLAGTPAYMSPEQASGAVAVDTRSDVYSLGVILYRLLTGHPPHDLSGSRLEALKRISTQEVQRPRKLCAQIDPELEAVLLKALAQDPEHRYGSAGELARDIERYLAGEQLEAAPPSLAYTLRKLARKHRLPLAIAAGFALVLLSATVVSSWQAVRATRARNAEARAAAKESAQRKQAELVAGLLESVFRRLDPDGEQEGEPDLKTQLVAKLDETAAKLDTDYGGEPLVRARLRNVLGQNQLGLGAVAKAEALFESALNEQRLHADPDDPRTFLMMRDLAWAYNAAGRTKEAIKLGEQVRDWQIKNLGPDNPDTLNTLGALAVMYFRTGRIDDSITLLEQTGEQQTRKLGPEHPDTLGTLTGLAVEYWRAGRTAQATRLLEQVRDQLIKKLGPDHPDTLMVMMTLARSYQFAGRTNEAIKLYEQVRDQRIKKLGVEHVLTLRTLRDLAICYKFKSQYAKAEPIWRRLSEWALTHPQGIPRYSITANEILPELITCYRGLGRSEQAAELLPKLRALLEDSLATQTAALAARPSDPALLADRGRSYAPLGRFREAVVDFDRAIELDPDQHLYWHEGAVPLRLATGDVEGYRNRRTEELHRLVATKQVHGPHKAAKDACMMPLEGEGLEITVKVADRALTESGMDLMASGYAALTKGMAEYRAGKYKEAIEWLHKSADGLIPDRDIQASLFQAMAYHQLGQKDQSQAMLANGDSLMDRYLSRPGEIVLGTGPSDWVFCQVLRREAESLINGERPSTHPIAATQP